MLNFALLMELNNLRSFFVLFKANASIVLKRPGARVFDKLNIDTCMLMVYGNNTVETVFFF